MLPHLNVLITLVVNFFQQRDLEEGYASSGSSSGDSATGDGADAHAGGDGDKDDDDADDADKDDDEHMGAAEAGSAADNDAQEAPQLDHVDPIASAGVGDLGGDADVVMTQ